MIARIFRVLTALAEYPFGISNGDLERINGVGELEDLSRRVQHLHSPKCTAFNSYSTAGCYSTRTPFHEREHCRPRARGRNVQHADRRSLLCWCGHLMWGLGEHYR